MDKIVLHGRKVVGGVVEGEALVTKETISGWGGIDVKTGTIIDVPRACRTVLRRESPGLPRRKGLLGLVQPVPPSAEQRSGALGDGFQGDNHKNRAGLRGYPLPRCH